MSLLRKFRDLLSPSAPPALRNRAGGLAWIKSHAEEAGAGAIAGQVVTTVRLHVGNFWIVDPVPSYVATRRMRDAGGRIYEAGSAVLVSALRDDVLTPIPDRGITDEEVRDLYALNLRAKEGQSA